MDIILSCSFTFGGIISVLVTLYSYKRYKDIIEHNRKTNYYPLNLKESKKYRLIKIDSKEHHICSSTDNLIKIKFKVITDLNTYRKFQVTNQKDEEVAVLKKTKHWFFGRDYIHITSKHRYELRSSTITNSENMVGSTIDALSENGFSNINFANSGLTDDYSTIETENPMVSPFIDPTLYSNYEVPLKEIGGSQILRLNEDFNRVERRKLFKIKIMLNKKSNKSTSFQINKNSLNYKWVNGSLMKISKNLKETTIMETLGIIEDTSIKNTEDDSSMVLFEIQLNVAQLEEIVGLLSLYLYLHQINGI